MYHQVRPFHPGEIDGYDLWIDGYHVPLRKASDPASGKPCFVGRDDEQTRILFDLANNRNPSIGGIAGYTEFSLYGTVVRLKQLHQMSYYTDAEVYLGQGYRLTWNDYSIALTAGSQPTCLGFHASPNKGISATWDVVKLMTEGGNLVGQIHSDIATRLMKVPDDCQDIDRRGRYALCLRVQRHYSRQGTPVIDGESFIAISMSTVTSEGAITITQNDLLRTRFSTEEETLYAHVLVLQEIDHPTVGGPYLNGDGIDCRGKFDTPG